MISAVIPLYNEEESLELLHKKLEKVLKQLGVRYEILLIDDGSTDHSPAVLKRMQKKSNHIRVFSFRKNQGKAEALTFAFGRVKGDYIVTLDADLQDDPSEIPRLLKRARDGFDVVCGSKLFNFLTNLFWGLSLHDYNCGLKMLTREAATSLRLYAGMHRFIPLLAHQEGFRVAELIVRHKKRQFGRSKYRISCRSYHQPFTPRILEKQQRQCYTKVFK